MKIALQSIRIYLVITLLTGVIYPLTMTDEGRGLSMKHVQNG